MYVEKNNGRAEISVALPHLQENRKCGTSFRLEINLISLVVKTNLIGVWIKRPAQCPE